MTYCGCSGKTACQVVAMYTIMMTTLFFMAAFMASTGILPLGMLSSELSSLSYAVISAMLLSAGLLLLRGISRRSPSMLCAWSGIMLVFLLLRFINFGYLLWHVAAEAQRCGGCVLNDTSLMSIAALHTTCIIIEVVCLIVVSSYKLELLRNQIRLEGQTAHHSQLFLMCCCAPCFNSSNANHRKNSSNTKNNNNQRRTRDLLDNGDMNSSAAELCDNVGNVEHRRYNNNHTTTTIMIPKNGTGVEAATTTAATAFPLLKDERGILM